MKIICIGRNYAEHAAEMGHTPPTDPIVFMKPPTALLYDGKPLYYPAFTHDLHHEAEIVLKIGRNGKKIEEQFAHKYYDQFTIGIDFTARDLQATLKAKGQPWELAKGFDGSAAVGEFLPFEDAHRLGINFALTKNGDTVQTGNTRDTIFTFDFIVHYVSQYFTLTMGDLIYTGTPAGVSAVSVGDVLVGSVEGKQLLRCEIK